MSTIRPRAWVENGVTTVKALISHPMETGLRKDKQTGKVIPAHYIQDLVVQHNGNTVLQGLLGPAVSKNPFINFTFTGAKAGDTLKISWSDNKGQTDEVETEIK